MEQEHYKGEKTLVWEVAEAPKIINHGYSERAMTAIYDTFGPFPITFGYAELRILRAMDAAGGWRPIADLIALVEKQGSIRVWAVPGWRPTKQEIAAFCETNS